LGRIPHFRVVYNDRVLVSRVRTTTTTPTSYPLASAGNRKSRPTWGATCSAVYSRASHDRTTNQKLLRRFTSKLQPRATDAQPKLGERGNLAASWNLTHRHVVRSSRTLKDSVRPGGRRKKARARARAGRAPEAIVDLSSLGHAAGLARRPTRKLVQGMKGGEQRSAGKGESGRGLQRAAG